MTDTRPGARLRPLHQQRDFALLWAGQAVSEIGTEVTAIALPLTAILWLHVDAGQLGLLQAALWVPWLLFALPIGAGVDRHRRCPLLILADSGRAVVIAVIVALAWSGTLSEATLLPLVFALGALTVLFEVTYLAYVPYLVRREQLVAANSSLQATVSVAQVGGPSLGGALVQALSGPAALLVDAVSYAASVTGLALIRAEEVSPGVMSSDDESMTARIRQGMRLTYRHRVMRSLLGVATTYNLFGQWFTTLFLLYAVRDLHLTAWGVGTVLSFGAAGAVVGSVLARWSIQTLGLGSALTWSVGIECVALSVVPVVDTSQLSWTMVILSSLFALNGMGLAASNVAAVSIRQALTPTRMLGRMSASYRFLSYGVVSIGSLLSGASGDLLGTRSGMTIAAVGLLLTLGWLLGPSLRGIRTLDDIDRTELIAAAMP